MSFAIPQSSRGSTTWSHVEFGPNGEKTTVTQQDNNPLLLRSKRNSMPCTPNQSPASPASPRPLVCASCSDSELSSQLVRAPKRSSGSLIVRVRTSAASPTHALWEFIHEFPCPPAKRTSAPPSPSPSTASIAEQTNVLLEELRLLEPLTPAPPPTPAAAARDLYQDFLDITKFSAAEGDSIALDLADVLDPSS